MTPVAFIAVAAAALQSQTAPLQGFTPAMCNVSRAGSLDDLTGVWLTRQGVSERGYAALKGTASAIGEFIQACNSSRNGDAFIELCTRAVAINDYAQDLIDAPVQPSGRLVSLTGREVRTPAALFEHADEFSIRCNVPAPEGSNEDEATGAHWSVRLGQTSKDMFVGEFALREFASFSLTDNRETNVEVSEIDATLGVIRQSANRRSSVLGYVSIDRSESDDPDADEDNLVQLGLAYIWSLDRSMGGAPGRVQLDHRFRLEAGYLTDDEFEAEGFRAQFGVSPGLNWLGYRRYSDLGGEGSPLHFAWLLDATLIDYLEIEETGEAFSDEADDYSRFGADLKLFIAPRDELPYLTPRFSLSYGVREPYGSDDPSVSLFTAGLQLSPSKTSNVSFEIAYEDGEDFASLKRKEQWTLSFGVRF